MSEIPVSEFVRECREAITEYLAMRKQGVPREQAITGLEVMLRERFKPRPPAWGDHRADAARNDA